MSTDPGAALSQAQKTIGALKAELLRLYVATSVTGLKPGALKPAQIDAAQFLAVTDTGEVVAAPQSPCGPDTLTEHLRLTVPFLFTDGLAGANGEKRPASGSPKTIAWNDREALSQNLEAVASGQVHIRGRQATA